MNKIFYELLCRVLNVPDPPEMIGVWSKPRGHVLRYPGLSVGRRDLMKRDLGQAYSQWRCHDYGQDYSEVVSIRRRSKNLRLA